VVIGRVGYSLAKGGQKQVSVHLNAAGLKLLRAAHGHTFTSEMTVSSTGGTKHKTVTL
jgi:hypothetical protein